jgi:hypothetical protein
VLTAFLVRFIPANLRVLTFAVGIFACLPAVVLFGVQLVLAKNATQATIAALLCSAAALGSLTHASILLAVTSSKNSLLWIANALLLVSLAIGCGGAALSALSQ